MVFESGTAEIYRVLDNFNEIEDSLVVGRNTGSDTEIVLFLKLKPEQTLDGNLKQKVSKLIREKTSPRHVPSKIIQAPDIPYTLNMKKVELAVKDILEGREVKNAASLQNPDCLDFYKNLNLQ